MAGAPADDESMVDDECPECGKGGWGVDKVSDEVLDKVADEADVNWPSLKV